MLSFELGVRVRVWGLFGSGFESNFKGAENVNVNAQIRERETKARQGKVRLGKARQG